MTQSSYVMARNQQAAPPQAQKAALSYTQANKLLGLLGSDDEFRALFKSQPRAALEVIGYELPATALIPMCMMVAELASKSEINHSHARLAAHLSGGARAAMTVIFTFESGVRSGETNGI